MFYRNRHNDGKYIAKLSLDELNCFYEQVASLACVIKEAKLVKVVYSLFCSQSISTQEWKHCDNVIMSIPQIHVLTTTDLRIE